MAGTVLVARSLTLLSKGKLWLRHLSVPVSATKCVVNHHTVYSLSLRFKPGNRLIFCWILFWPCGNVLLKLH